MRRIYYPVIKLSRTASRHAEGVAHLDDTGLNRR